MARVLRPLWGRFPAFEHALLIGGLLCTMYGKYAALIRVARNNLLIPLAGVLGADLAFFGTVAMLVAITAALFSRKGAPRINLLIMTCVAGWSAANMAWLIATGSQLHFRVLTGFLHNPIDMGPIVFHRLAKSPALSIYLAVGIIVAGGALLQRFIRPKRIPSMSTSARIRVISVSAAVTAIGLLCSRIVLPGDARYAALAFSSHWFGLTSVTGFDGSYSSDDSPETRHVAREGGRIIQPPPETNRPLVVMIVMESTARWATSFGGHKELTPTLSDLARRGIEFEQTRAVVTHTTQSLFSMLTGVWPGLDGGFVEAVPVDSPYESLATVLRRFGYRSRFCQMVQGSFECRPGLAANLGFDSFWSRENANDPSTHLGYFAGDDFKMIPPAFEWLDRQAGPAFLLFMTSVAHDPYELPEWAGPRPSDDLQAYLQCVRFTDAFVREVVAQLMHRGAFDDTLLCVVGDHGEGFHDHDIRQHNENPFEEALRVPWIVTWPRRLATARSVNGNCCLLDVTPTLLGLLGCGIDRAGFDGLDATGPIAMDRRTYFFGWYPTSPAGFVESDKKWVGWPSSGTAYSYDRNTDPGELAPAGLSEQARDLLLRDLSERRSRARIAYESRRFRQRVLFDRWETLALGDKAWCFHLMPRATVSP